MRSTRLFAALAGVFTLGSVAGVVTQMRPPQASDFGSGGPQSPIVINGITGEAWIYVNGVMTLLNSLNINGFGADPTGVRDSTKAFQDAAATLRTIGGGTLQLQAGANYKVFAGVNAQTFLMDLSGTTNVVILGNGATITSTLVNTAQSVVAFYGAPFNGFAVDSLTFIGGNTTLRTGGESLVAFSGGSRNVRVTNVIAKNCGAGVGCTDNTTKQTGVVVLNGYFERCFYPLSLWGTDDVLAHITTVNCGRSYFPVAPCDNHDVYVNSQSGYTSSDCLLKVYADPGKSVADNTISNIRLTYRSGGRYPGAGNQADGIIEMDIEQATVVSGAGHFRDVRIAFTMDGGSGVDKPSNIFNMNRYLFGGGHDTTVRGHSYQNISISGSASNWNNSDAGGVVICPTAAGDVWTGDLISGFALRDLQILGVPPGDAISVNGQGAIAGTQFLSMDNVRVDGAITYASLTNANISRRAVSASNSNTVDNKLTAFTPTWVGGSPTIGNGTLAGNWARQGDMVDVTIMIQPGSTTTFGAGAYTLSLPFTCAGTDITLGVAYAFEGGVANHIGICYVAAGASVANVIFNSPGISWGAAAPWTFKNGDTVRLSIRYPATA